jgi:hypothetical protein
MEAVSRRRTALEADTAKYSGRAMAIHEAGHAVAGLDVGLTLDYVMLGRANDVAGTQLFRPRGGGWYLPPEFCNEQVHRAAMARLIMGWAGTLAEDREMSTRHELNPGVFPFVGITQIEDDTEAGRLPRASSDRRGIGELAEALAWGPGEAEPLLEWTRARATNLVDLRWPDVDLVADALLQHGRLTSQRIRTLLRKARSERWAALKATWDSDSEASTARS